jgi:uncharacterized membrane protein
MMSEPIANTTHDDAPLSSAKKPDVHAAATLREDEGKRVDDSRGDELIGRTITINRPRAEVYAFWRNFRNFPSFMENIASVEVIDNLRSRWVVKAPADKTVEWISVITREVPGEVIAWSSERDASVSNSGSIAFRDAPAGRGTEVTATIVYDPPAGSVGKLLAKLFQREPNIQVRRDLRRFKQLLETGEIATAQPPYAAPRS